tara:strand:- start:42048 stop:43205 length:1158 start_codon:yes stop_codon:yes gene_type:complete
MTDDKQRRPDLQADPRIADDGEHARTTDRSDLAGRKNLAGRNSLASRRATVVLGGGGARGLAHLGAIQAIKEAGLQIERVVGVSIGALAGAMCGAQPDIHAVQDEVISLLTSASFRRHQAQFFGAARTDAAAQKHDTRRAGTRWYRRVRRVVTARNGIARAARGSSALPAKVLKELVNALVPDVAIEELRFPLSIVTVDLLSGRRVVIDSGSARDAVQASASIPGVFPPVRTGEMLLADIGVIDSLPTVVAHAFGPSLTIAVDVGQNFQPVPRCDSAIDAILRVQSIAEQELRRSSLALADIVLRPNVQNAWFDFSNPEEVIRDSYHVVSQQLAAIHTDARPISDPLSPPTNLAPTNLAPPISSKPISPTLGVSPSDPSVALNAT